VMLGGFAITHDFAFNVWVERHPKAPFQKAGAQF
jgi:hypothetical protein